MRDVVFVGSSLKDLRDFPAEARREEGFALQSVQAGEKPDNAKPLKGVGGAGIQEIVADEEGGTFRVVYTVTLPDAIYVLHAFQKKAKHGIATTKRDLDVIRQRLREAQERSSAQTRAGEGRRP